MRASRQGALITVHPIFFSQGINEQQTYANAIGESTVQDTFNWESLLLLRAYCAQYRAFLGGERPSKSVIGRVDQAEAAINSLAASIVGSRRNKNTDVLVLGERAARLYANDGLCAPRRRPTVVADRQTNTCSNVANGGGPGWRGRPQVERWPRHKLQERQGSNVDGGDSRNSEPAAGQPPGNDACMSYSLAARMSVFCDVTWRSAWNAGGGAGTHSSQRRWCRSCATSCAAMACAW